MEYGVILVYLLPLVGLTVIGAPIAALVFRDLPTRGAPFSLPTALVPFAIAVFWIGQVSYGRHTTLLAAGVVATSGWLAHRRGARPDWRAVSTGFGVFAVGFAILLVLRVANPSITAAGGEQFLHYGLVNALERAPHLPPEDFWYAGAPLRYYYGTQLQVTSLSLLSGTDPRYGYNLGLATFYGVLFVVAYGLTGSIVHARGYDYKIGGAFGALFVALGGPTTTPIRLLTPHLPDVLSDAIAPAAFGFVANRFEGGDLAGTVAEHANLLEWSWWYTRYVVPGTLQEVPFYSFVKADLHGHALSTGYVLFTAALAYAYSITPHTEPRRRLAILVAGIGSVAGVFGFMNTWSLPTAAGMAFLALAVADPAPESLLPARFRERLDLVGPVSMDYRSLRTEVGRLVLGVVAAAVVTAIGVVLASPFLVFGHLPVNEGVGFLPQRSPLGPFLVIYAGLLTVFALRLLQRWWDTTDAAMAVTAPMVAGALAFAFLVAGLGFALDAGVPAVLVPLLVAGWVLVRTGRGGFALVLCLAGIGLLLAMELIHARIPRIDQPRWNTTLKVAVQGWTLAAAGVGAAAAMLFERARGRLADAYMTAPREDTGGVQWLAPAAIVLLVVTVVVSTAVFPAMVVGHELGPDLAADTFDPTLDGHDGLETWRPHEAAAIQWLDERAGRPTIVEAPGETPYTYASPASTYTGLPTVVGWSHEELYRGIPAFERRVEHVDAIYAGEWATAAHHLAAYDVTYVYVGENERERYGDDLRSFDRPAFTIAYENEQVTIYRVDSSALEDVDASRKNVVAEPPTY